MKESKPYNIPKKIVLEAYKLIKANNGSAGIDGVDFEKFEKNLKNNLYKVWNRMSSGSYFPSPVMSVEIPKKSGGTRRLGIPTITDRIAQMVVKMYVEPKVEPMFHEDSYGYRPHKSAIEAVGQARKRCWKYDYVIEFDIRGLFDNIDHELLMKVVERHVEEKWIRLYIVRWLKTPFELKDGTKVERSAGTPQGGVISPLLANMFMHYVFDKWMCRNFPYAPFERYADDAVVHCRTEKEAEEILKMLDGRMKSCKLELHPQKTKIIYCKDEDRKREYSNVEFDFLGYTFKGIFIKYKTGRMGKNFIASASKKSNKLFREKMKALEIHKKTGCKIEMIAENINPIVRGWINYFGRYNAEAIKYSLDCVERRLIRWAMCKYKRFRRHRRMAEKWLSNVRKREPNLFAHWNYRNRNVVKN
ncbi:group II intron reverse transcriptase/maturase [Clostridium ljungdahlii]|uniref:RNA-directed DNA polymerase n=1 Tax=Clostridium ljungdahlii TaxID=1538 RepID=A0A162L3L1_9CLOT|nr:group II intron reverse transcriptase/maturase [Clostridium ljungdahlii]OAA90662.1 Group II intron-encoded protein LtrA [Clostridium ljungdahlii]